MKIADDAKAKKRWNVLVDGKVAGGVYATSLGGQVTGFRAGRMEPGFQGALIIDDPLKPEDAFSDAKLNAANRKLLTTVKSRKAKPDTPVIAIMQRIADHDSSAFIKSGALGGEWTHVVIPAILDDQFVMDKIPKKYWKGIKPDAEGRFSYWAYKEPIAELLAMERGEGTDLTGSRMSRHVFSSQYQQSPTALGGNIIRSAWFGRYTVLPQIKYRKIYADTAQKTKERNDYSVFELWGYGIDGRIYLMDLLRGKWEAPELKRKAIDFWLKHASVEAYPRDKFGQLRQLVVEDKSSGTGLIQELKTLNQIPVKGIEREKDKLTRVMDVLSYIEQGMVVVPLEAPFVSDFLTENEAFTADDTHDFDDQIDPMVDAVVDLLTPGNKLEQYKRAMTS